MSFELVVTATACVMIVASLVYAKGCSGPALLSPRRAPALTYNRFCVLQALCCHLSLSHSLFHITMFTTFVNDELPLPSCRELCVCIEHVVTATACVTIVFLGLYARGCSGPAPLSPRRATALTYTCLCAPCFTLVPDLCPRMLADVSFYTTTAHESQGHA